MKRNKYIKLTNTAFINQINKSYPAPQEIIMMRHKGDFYCCNFDNNILTFKTRTYGPKPLSHRKELLIIAFLKRLSKITNYEIVFKSNTEILRFSNGIEIFQTRFPIGANCVIQYLDDKSQLEVYISFQDWNGKDDEDTFMYLEGEHELISYTAYDEINEFIILSYSLVYLHGDQTA